MILVFEISYAVLASGDATKISDVSDFRLMPAVGLAVRVIVRSSSLAVLDQVAWVEDFS